MNGVRGEKGGCKIPTGGIGGGVNVPERFSGGEERLKCFSGASADGVGSPHGVVFFARTVKLLLLESPSPAPYGKLGGGIVGGGRKPNTAATASFV